MDGIHQGQFVSQVRVSGVSTYGVATPRPLNASLPFRCTLKGTRDTLLKNHPYAVGETMQRQSEGSTWVRSTRGQFKSTRGSRRGHRSAPLSRLFCTVHEGHKRPKRCEHEQVQGVQRAIPFAACDAPFARATPPPSIRQTPPPWCAASVCAASSPPSSIPPASPYPPPQTPPNGTWSGDRRTRSSSPSPRGSMHSQFRKVSLLVWGGDGSWRKQRPSFVY